MSLNLGGGDFAAPIYTPAGAYCGRTARILDSDGDGRAEVWNASNYACTESITVGLDDDGRTHVDTQTGLGFEAKRAIFVDLNGDGLRDIVRPASPAGWVRWSTGTGYGPKQDLVDGPYPEPNATDAMDQGTYAVDLNSDGREDILTLRLAPSPKIIAYLSKGDGSFNPVEIAAWPGMFHALEGFSTTRPGDFNGDGLVDIVEVGPDGRLRVLVQTPGEADIVDSIGDYVAEHPRDVFLYSRRWSDNPKPASCTFPQTCVKHGLPVVREHWVWQGEDVGQYRRTLYSYEDPRVDLSGRGFLGFGEVRVRDEGRRSETTITFDHATRVGTLYPYAGLPKTVTHVAPILDGPPTSLPAVARARVSRVETTYALKPASQLGTNFSYAGTRTTDEWEQGVALTPAGADLTVDPNPPVLRHRDEAFEFDAYGNCTKAEATTQGGVTGKIVSTYDIRPNDWLIALPDTTVFTSAKAGAGTPPARVTQYVHDALGQLETVQVEPTSANPQQRLTITYERNGDGLVTKTTWHTPGEAPRHEHVSYEDTEGSFPKYAWNDLGHLESFAFHPAYGLLAASKDINGVVTRRQFDTFGRLRRVERDGEAGVDEKPWIRLQNGWVWGMIDISQSDAGDERFVVFDELGRPVEEASRGFDGQWAHTAASYDLLGRLRAVTRPSFGAISPNATTYQYDTLDRLREVKAPDGATTTRAYSFFEETTWDPRKRESRLTYDVDGRVVKSVDVIDGQEVATAFAYGAFDQIEQVTDAEGNETSIGYDLRGRRTSLADPDRGLTTFAWNGFDELLWEENAIWKSTYHRDALGRVVQKDEADGPTTSVTTYVWATDNHGLGKLGAATAPDGTKTEFAYDEFGRPAGAKWTIDGQPYAVNTFYDDLGRVQTIQYPEVPNRARFTVEYAYNAQNFLEDVRDAAQGKPFRAVKARNADGALTEALFGDGALHTRTYFPLTGRLDVLHTERGGLPLDELSHTYYPDGDLKDRLDGIAKRTESFDYDELDRLSRWTLTNDGTERETTYFYDPLGNLTKVFVDSMLVDDNTYGANGRPHALTSTKKGASYTYDDIGRVVQGGDRTITYTAFDLPTSITQAGKVTMFGYDAFQRRVRKSADSAETVYVADLYERRAKNGSIEHVFYVPGEAGPVAEVHFDEKTQEEKTLYLHRDALGSVRVITDENGGSKDERVYFEPFGQRIQADGTPVAQGFSSPVEIGFTGHHHDDDLGLIDMRGRLYDPAIRRFLTPDPLVAFPLFGQSYNRFAYGLNNPLSFIDPTGFNAESSGCAEKALCTITTRAPKDLDTGQKRQRAGAGRSNGSAPKSSAPAADAAGAAPPTGATAQASPSPSAAPAPAIEASSAPVPSAPASSGYTVALSGIGMESEGSPEGESWRDDAIAQGIRGFAFGAAAGMIPGGAIAERFATSAGVFAPQSRAEAIGRAIGEMVGGAALSMVGMGGTAAGGGLTVSGTGTAVGIPVALASAGVTALGAVNTAIGFAGLLQALSTGGGAAGPKGAAGGERTGKTFTPSGKRQIDAENAARNHGLNKCENC